MPEPAQTRDGLIDYVRQSGLVEPDRLMSYLEGLESQGPVPDEPPKLAACLVRDGLLTQFQAQQLLRGRFRNFMIGKFKILEPLGTGGMSKVFLGEHRVMGHRVALKLLPMERVADPSSVGRFHREARAIAALNHPNIVRAHDIDKEGDRFYYMIMDYVEGVNLHDLIRRNTTLSPEHAAHYMAQAAEGLQHIYEAGLVHRDLKPGNLILDISGTVKILDLGLARFMYDTRDNLTKNYDNKAILGTADYLSPEQALRSSHVDIRADIYSLGATMYFLLVGRAPFESESVTQKLLSHQLRAPTPLATLRKDLPPGLIAVVEKMMAKKPDDRYQEPHELVEALAPWTQTPIPPPDPATMPRHSPSSQSPQSGPRSSRKTPVAGLSSTIRRPALSSSQLSPPPAPESSAIAPESAIVSGSSVFAPESAVTVPASAVQSPHSPPSWKRWLVVSLVVTLFAAAGAGGYVWLFLHSDQSRPSSTEARP